MEWSVYEGALGCLPVNIAILDSDADIIYTNRAWREFGEEENSVAPDSLGDNYLEVCDRAAGEGDEDAERAAKGVRGLLSGEKDVFSFEYPCHSPTARRWFVMYASAFEVGDETYLSVAHLNVTRRKLSELRVEERNQTLSEFAHSLSHDLRNPLNVATGYLEMEREDNDSERLGKTESALHRMNEMITDVLELAELGETVGETELVELQEVAREAWENVDVDGSTLVVEDTSMKLDSDRSQLLRLFENLFRNSVEHVGSGVSVRVGSTEDSFYVEDDGLGIPDEDISGIFDKGRGMNIVRDVAEGHGWELCIREATDGGTRFVFKLNLAVDY